MLSKRVMFGSVLVGCGLATALGYAVVHKTTTTATITPIEAKASVGAPVQLAIPAIEVDAKVEDVGLTPDGAMDSPSNQDGVAWYQLGPRPGEIGSAVMAGHYGWKSAAGSVFDNLHKLQPGDTVNVTDDAGVQTTFVVRESKMYDLKMDDTDVFHSTDGIAHLNLVTCGGVWNEDKHMYSNRLVVFTDKE